MKLFSLLNQPTKQKLTHWHLFAGLVLSIASPHFANAQPSNFAPFEVEYDIGNNMINAGKATLKLAKQEENWVYSLSTTPTGVFKLTGKGKIQETSHFTLAEDVKDTLKIVPLTYSYRQDNETRRSVDAWFDESNKQLRYQQRGKETTEALSNPVLDRLSVTLSIIDKLKRDSFENAELQVFDKGRIKNMLFANEGNETLDTKMGPLKTVRVRSNAIGGATRHTTTWFAPELDYVPIKIEQYKRDKLIARLTLTRLSNRVTESGGAPEYSGKK